MENKWNSLIGGQNEEKTLQPREDIKLEPSTEKTYNRTRGDQNYYSKQSSDIDDYIPRYDKLAMDKKLDKYYKYNPKPLGKKNNRSFVPEDKKTEEYWQKRIKNNVAARKSREDRRRKELETLTKKSSYEKENLELKLFIQKLETENQYLSYEISLLRESKNY